MGLSKPSLEAQNTRNSVPTYAISVQQLLHENEHLETVGKRLGTSPVFCVEGSECGRERQASGVSQPELIPSRTARLALTATSNSGSAGTVSNGRHGTEIAS